MFQWKACGVTVILVFALLLLGGAAWASGQAATTTEEVRFTLVIGGDPNLSPDNDKVGQYIREKIYKDTGDRIYMEPIWVPWNNIRTKISTMLAAQEGPDATTAENGHELYYKGWLMDLTELAEKYAPAMKKAYTPGEIGFYRAKDGVQYGLPSGGRNVNYTVTLREDKMNLWGIPKKVQSLADLEAAFDKVRSSDPNCLPVAATYGRWVNLLTPWANMISVPYTVTIRNEIMIPGYLLPEMKNLLTIARRWYEKGYVLKDVMTIAAANAEKIFERGDAFAVIDFADMAVRWRFGKRLNTIDPTAVPFTVGPISTPYDSVGHLWGANPYGATGSLIVFKSTKKPQAEAAVKYYNWELEDPINWLITHFGIPDDHFYVKDGRFGYPDKWKNEGAPEIYSGFWKLNGEPPMHADPPFMPPNVDDLPQFLSSQRMLAAAPVLYNPVYANCPYFPMGEYTTQFSDALSQLSTLAAEIIVGIKDLSAWEQAPALWDKAGGKNLSDLLMNVYNQYRRDK